MAVVWNWIVLFVSILVNLSTIDGSLTNSRLLGLFQDSSRYRRAPTSGLYNVTIIKNTVPVGPHKMREIYVDSTISELTIHIKANISGVPGSKLTKPSGSLLPPFAVPGITINDIGGGVKEYILKPPDRGQWILEKGGNETWDLEVTAKSSIDITTTFMKKTNGKLTKISGRPTLGDEVTVNVTVSDMKKVGAMNMIVLTDHTGAALGNAMFTGVTGKPDQFEATFTLPSQAFQLTIMGQDASNHPIQRLDTTKTVSPVPLELTFGHISPLYVDEDLSLPYTVANLGSTQTVASVHITDDQGFLTASAPVNYTLNPGTNKTGTYTLHAGKTIGVITIVTLTAQAVDVSGSSPHQEVMNLTVERRPDLTPPVCNVTSVTGSCDLAQLDPCQCDMHTWTGSAKFGDEGYGLSDISSSGGKVGDFTHDSFAPEDTISKGYKNANIKSTCCSPQVHIKVIDMANNTGDCVFDVSHGKTPPTYACTTTTPMSTTTTVAPTSTAAKPAAVTTVGPSDKSGSGSGTGSGTGTGGIIPGTSIKDSIPPICTVTGKHGSCSDDQAKDTICDDIIWFGTVEFGDEGSGLFEVTSTAGPDALFTNNTFSKGDTIASGMRSAKLITTCCHPLIYVMVVDMAGNSAQCELDVREQQVYDSPELSDGGVAGVTVGALAALVGAILIAVLITKYARCCKSATHPNIGQHKDTPRAWQ